ncbi:collagen-binding protein [Niabella ginsenosidivorans]|uniref:Collagen-binding protein n=2 Tax=Niabella ginsenosidivorans TaxID=1176587 RepID=A0A1A9I8T4_9BACT|nr:collagen-binding protein [Niabella ginsenosidivorans]
MDPVEGVTVGGATVVLENAADSSVKASTISDKEGKFAFTNLSLGAYTLKATSIGFEQLENRVVLADSMPDLDLGDVYIPKKTTTLAGVVVVATAPPVTQKGDTTQFSASQYKTNPDATVEDLIKKMPGISVDRNGNITGHGEQVKKVTVDGKDFFGDDATAAIKNLPADVVDKIQLYDRMSDQAQLTGFDDGNSVKAINIVTRNGMKEAQFGKIFGGLGTRNTYNAGGNMNIFDGDRRISVIGNFNNINAKNFSDQDVLGVLGGGRGPGGGGRGGGGGGINLNQPSGINKVNTFGINYNDKWGKKVNFSASYFFNNANNVTESNSIKQTPLGTDTTWYTYNNSNSSSNNNNHRINMRMEYQIDSSNSLYIIPSIGIQNYNGSNYDLTRSLYNTGDSVNYQDAHSTSHRDGYNIGNNLMFRHSFGKRGRTISASLQTTYTENKGYSYNNQYTIDYLADSITNANRYIDNPTKGSNISGRLSYTEPVGQKGMLEFNYTTGVQKNEADQKTYDYDGSAYTDFNPGLSNTFKNRIITNNGGVNYRLGRGRDNQLSLGVNVQHSKLVSDRVYPVTGSMGQSFTSVLPNLRWMKKIGRYSNIRLFYRANTDFPSINQLQDIVDSTNKLYISSGNPNLKQSYTNFGALRYMYTNTRTSKSFIANIRFQSADNYIVQSTVLENGITYSKPINLNGYKNLSSFFVYSMPLKFIKTNLNLNAGYNYATTPGSFNNHTGKTVTNNYSGGIALTSNISEYVDFNLSYNLNYYDSRSDLNSKMSNAKTNYINQTPALQLNLLSKNGWFIETDVTSQIYSGLSQGYNQQFWLWNAGAGKKFLKNHAAELRLSAFDILKQNQSISRTIGTADNSITDANTRVLQQYFMLTFTYKLKNIGKPKASYNEERRHWRGGPPGEGRMPGGGGPPGGGPMF